MGEKIPRSDTFRHFGGTRRKRGIEKSLPGGKFAGAEEGRAAEALGQVEGWRR